jgi:isopentenyl diphosphate isomerase/L-lactate dehydrogenase-like FMN-dependent dehydrogenase
MRLQDALSIGDLERLAQKRLPRVLFDCIGSGVEDEQGVIRNETAFQKHLLLARHLVDVSNRDQATTIFGRTYASPFGISPTGIAEIFRRGADSMLAQAAAAAKVPSIISGSCMTPPETIAQVSRGNAWFQLYAARDPNISDDFVQRALDAGYTTMVLTVDNPVFPKMERDKRNGFSVPFRLTVPLLIDAMMHPRWTAEWLMNGGLPMMRTWQRYAPAGATASEVALFRRSQNPSVQTWRDVERFRRLWPGNFVIKGLARASDAVRAANAGVDGVIVSNHGGKTLDRAPATVDALVAIAAAVGDRMVVMLDSGVRRGSDIIIGLCLGARFVFVGRATLYGVTVGGVDGARKALDILRDEVDMTMALIGCPSVAELGPDFLFENQGRVNNQAIAAE